MFFKGFVTSAITNWQQQLHYHSWNIKNSKLRYSGEQNCSKNILPNLCFKILHFKAFQNITKNFNKPYKTCKRREIMSSIAKLAKLAKLFQITLVYFILCFLCFQIFLVFCAILYGKRFGSFIIFSCFIEWRCSSCLLVRSDN